MMNDLLVENALVPVDLTDRLARVEEALERLRTDVDGLMAADKVTIVCFSGDWDKLYAALSIASGAASLGREVNLFFTFWAVGALYRGSSGQPSIGKRPTPSLIQRLFCRMLPRGPGQAGLSRMNYLGLGRKMLDRVMQQEGMDDIEALQQQVVDLGVHLHVCSTSARLFGMSHDEFSHSDQLNTCGVATLMGIALESRVVLFV